MGSNWIWSTLSYAIIYVPPPKKGQNELKYLEYQCMYIYTDTRSIMLSVASINQTCWAFLREPHVINQTRAKLFDVMSWFSSALWLITPIYLWDNLLAQKIPFLRRSITSYHQLPLQHCRSHLKRHPNAKILRHKVKEFIFIQSIVFLRCIQTIMCVFGSWLFFLYWAVWKSETSIFCETAGRSPSENRAMTRGRPSVPHMFHDLKTMKKHSKISFRKS